MRILFFPSDLGGGFGHISRCLALAYEAEDRGHKCGFVLNSRKYVNKIRNNFDLFISELSSPLSSFFSFFNNKLGGFRAPLFPLFVEVSGLDYQVVRDGLGNPNLVRKKLAQYLDIVRAFRPDVLIGDANLLLWVLSQKAALPIVQIVRYAFHPRTAKLIWWKAQPEDLAPPNSSLLFNPLLKEAGLGHIRKAEELLKGNLYIVPSIPEVEPIPEDGKTFHVGELTISKTQREVPAWLQEIDSRHPLVYVTIGGGAGPVGNKLFFSTIVEAFADKPIQVIVSTSSKFDSLDFSRTPNNIRFFPWVPGKLLISKANAVVFHGGHGTMMEILAAGKPSIVAPFTCEQEGNGRRLDQLGCGMVVRLSKQPYKSVEARWRYGTYSFLIQNRYDLDAGELSTKVATLLHNSEYSSRAQYLKKEIKNYGGPRKAIDLIEKF